MEVIYSIYENERKWGKTNKYNIQDNEYLAEKVQKYPCLLVSITEEIKEKERLEGKCLESS